MEQKKQQQLRIPKNFGKKNDQVNMINQSNDTMTEYLPSEDSDQKVVEFLSILNEYREKCEVDGNFDEAMKARVQFENLRDQEQKRQLKALRARQIAERQTIETAHSKQFSDFNASWDKYIEDYDEMSARYLKQVTEKHILDLRKYQEELHKKLLSRPPKFSKELLEWRKREHALARQKNYTEAQRIRLIADQMEADEIRDQEGFWESQFETQERKFREKQQTEVKGLMNRIETKRRQYIQQRQRDTQRLLQRNANVQNSLVSKQTTEKRVSKHQIKTNLLRIENPGKGSNANDTTPSLPSLQN